MRKLLASVAVVLFTAASITHAEEHGRVAVQAEMMPLSLADFVSLFGASSLVSDPPCIAGVRFYPNNRLGIDLMAGLMRGTSVKYDSASGTDADPGLKATVIHVGIAYKTAEGEKGSLALLGRFSMFMGEASDFLYSGAVDKYATYDVTIPSVFVGIEPSYEISRNIHLFANYGLRMVFMPNSKWVDTNDPNYDFDADKFPLKESKDATTRTVTSGILLGFRYVF